LGVLKDLLDNLLLLNQESTDDTVLNAVTAAGTTVCARDVLARTRDLGVFTRAKSGDLELKLSDMLPVIGKSQDFIH
jgi:hypothetical protein